MLRDGAVASALVSFGSILQQSLKVRVILQVIEADREVSLINVYRAEWTKGHR